MATDATGTPTALGIPKFNTSVDAPSGLGGNAQMDSIDALIQANTSFKGAGIVIKGNKLISTDANTAFSLFGDGTMKWGAGGASALDITMQRLSAQNLYINGAFNIGLGLVVDYGNTGTALYFGSVFDTYIQRESAGFIRVTNGINAITGYKVNGVALAATHLSNGTTGSGAVVLGTSPSIASPGLTGTPTAPTQLDADNSTAIATTAWVRTRISASSVSSVFGRTGAVVANSGDYNASQVTNAADKSATTEQAFLANVNAHANAVSLGSAGAYTPDSSQYQVHIISWTAGPTPPNVGNPASQAAGRVITFVVKNVAVSGAVFMNGVLQGTQYKGVNSATSFTNNQTAAQSFVSDGTNWLAIGPMVGPY